MGTEPGIEHLAKRAGVLHLLLAGLVSAGFLALSGAGPGLWGALGGLILGYANIRAIGAIASRVGRGGSGILYTFVFLFKFAALAGAVYLLARVVRVDMAAFAAAMTAMIVSLAWVSYDACLRSAKEESR
jgi:hypothetical protein